MFTWLALGLCPAQAHEAGPPHGHPQRKTVVIGGAIVAAVSVMAGIIVFYWVRKQALLRASDKEAYRD